MSLSSILAKLTGSSEAPTIDHENFSRAVANNSCAIVDVREPHEYAAGHIPGAVNMPLSSFSPEALPSGKPVVIVCMAGGRSAKALQQALRAGRTDICHYPPGTGGWRNAGGPLVS